MIKKYDVTGMTCSACSSGIERTVVRLKGVISCEVSLMGKSMKLEVDETSFSEEQIIDTVKSLGYGIYVEGQGPQEKNREQKSNLFIRFVISMALLVPLMYVSMGHMFGVPIPSFLDPHKGNSAWFALYQAILSVAIIAINYEFFKNGTVAIFKRVPNMDTLVALGSGVSFIYSVVLTVFIFIGKDAQANAMNLHFESAAMILCLVTLGKWLEDKSKKRTGSEIEKLLKLAPDTVTVETDGETKTVSISEVKVGDILVVKFGEYIPVDGRIVSGNAFVDKCAVTGESLPVEVSEGDWVTSAAIVKGGLIKIRAEKVGGETTLSKIIKMVKEAGASKAPIQKIADKIAGIFVPIVVMISLLTFIIWLIIDGGFNPEHCITYAISVLVVSCPCALGLATPVAIMTATGKGASLGILYKDAESLQKVCGINAVLLDKTATLTEGKPKVTDFITFYYDRDRALKIACGIEKNSNHPLAKCIVDYAGQGVKVNNFHYYVGKGATAECEGITYFLGNRKLLENIKIAKEAEKTADDLSACGKTVMFLSDGKRVLALIAVADTVKEGSKEAVTLLKSRNCRVAMLTGDESRTLGTIAWRLP